MTNKKLLKKQLLKRKGISLFCLVLASFFFLLYFPLSSILVSATHSNCLIPGCDYTRCVGNFRCTQWPSCVATGPEIRCGHPPVSESCSCNRDCGAKCALDSDCGESKCIDADGDKKEDDWRQFKCDTNSCGCSVSYGIDSSACAISDSGTSTSPY